MIKIKGHEIAIPHVKDSFNRRAVQLQNSIILTLKPLGIERDDVHLPMEKVAQKKAPASVGWYFDNRNLKYSYALRPSFVENLMVIDKILKLEVQRLLSEEISTEEFVREFSEDDDLEEQRLEARKLLGVSPDETSFEVINKNYKLLAKKCHPDMPEGDHLLFQKINAAHKLLRKELT